MCDAQENRGRLTDLLRIPLAQVNTSKMIPTTKIVSERRRRNGTTGRTNPCSLSSGSWAIHRRPFCTRNRSLRLSSTPWPSQTTHSMIHASQYPSCYYIPQIVIINQDYAVWFLYTIIRTIICFLGMELSGTLALTFVWTLCVLIFFVFFLVRVCE